MCIFLILGDVTLVLIEDLVFKLAIYRAGTSKRLFIFNFFLFKRIFQFTCFTYQIWVKKALTNNLSTFTLCF